MLDVAPTASTAHDRRRSASDAVRWNTPSHFRVTPRRRAPGGASSRYRQTERRLHCGWVAHSLAQRDEQLGVQSARRADSRCAGGSAVARSDGSAIIPLTGSHLADALPHASRCCARARKQRSPACQCPRRVWYHLWHCTKLTTLALSPPLAPEEYRYMLRTYLLTFIAGCVICGSAIGTFVILGVYASWLVMFVRLQAVRSRSPLTDHRWWLCCVSLSCLALAMARSISRESPSVHFWVSACWSACLVALSQASPSPTTTRYAQLRHCDSVLTAPRWPCSRSSM